MVQRYFVQAQSRAQDSTRTVGSVLQRKCDKCRKKRSLLRRAAVSRAPETVPPIVHEALRSPGQPLDAATRAFMEPRFGHDFGGATSPGSAMQIAQRDLIINRPDDRYEREADRTADYIMKASPRAAARGFDFSKVRIHTDAIAAESARKVDALAFTVGDHIVFGTGRYAPNSSSGRRLLAHELAHVVQQDGNLQASWLQREEAEVARPRPAPVDANAQRIIDLAQDTSRPIEERAVAVVQAIINQYFPNDRDKISQIRYRAALSGLDTTSSGQGARTTGILRVGQGFVENTTLRHFARRVLQVRHEIQHVEQQRAGMSGERRQDEREFAAFHDEALAAELPGTGRVQHSTRVQLIDAALGYYYCLSPALQQANISQRD